MKQIWTLILILLCMSACRSSDVNNPSTMEASSKASASPPIKGALVLRCSEEYKLKETFRHYQVVSISRNGNQLWGTIETWIYDPKSKPRNQFQEVRVQELVKMQDEFHYSSIGSSNLVLYRDSLDKTVWNLVSDPDLDIRNTDEVIKNIVKVRCQAKSHF